MLYCTHQIRTKGTDIDDQLYPDASISTPWPDLRQSRAGTWSEQKDRYNTTILSDGREMKYYWDHPSYPFRVFKSHYGPPELPVRKKGGKKIKYIAMVRNGIDVAASFTTFFSSHSEKFRSLWGGKLACHWKCGLILVSKHSPLYLRSVLQPLLRRLPAQHSR